MGQASGRSNRWTPPGRRPQRPRCSTKRWSVELEALDDPELRQIALWRLEGYTNREISDRLDCTERSVERRMERIRSEWLSYDDRAE